MNVYILLTADRARAYTTRARAVKVHTRAQRMGVKVEFISTEAKTGDPYPRHPLPVDPWGSDAERDARDACTVCSPYARAEAGFADSGRD